MHRGPDTEAGWGDVLAHVIDAGHLVSGEQLSTVADDAARKVGLSAEVLLVDLVQRVLAPVRPGAGADVAVVDTTAGRAYRLGEILAEVDEGTGCCGSRCSTVPTGSG